MINWTKETKPVGEMKVVVKFRYRQEDKGCILRFIDHDTVELIYDEPYKAVTPGQAAVFYDGENCLGGGIIDSIYYGDKEMKVYDYEFNS